MQGEDVLVRASGLQADDKELTVFPGRTVTIKDAAYGLWHERSREIRDLPQPARSLARRVPRCRRGLLRKLADDLAARSPHLPCSCGATCLTSQHCARQRPRSKRDAVTPEIQRREFPLTRKSTVGRYLQSASYSIQK